MNTLWELAQSWEHDNTGTVFEPLHAPELCHRCQLEQLMREKDKRWRELQLRSGTNLMGLTVIEDLGVPEDK